MSHWNNIGDDMTWAAGIWFIYANLEARDNTNIAFFERWILLES